MKNKLPTCDYCNGNVSLLKTSNHIIGCNLESIAQVLRFRGLEEEAKKLDCNCSKNKMRENMKSHKRT